MIVGILPRDETSQEQSIFRLRLKVPRLIDEQRETLMPRLFSHLVRLAVVAALACSATIAVAQTQKLMVFAAASLKNALDEVTQAYQRQGHPMAAISYAASSALAKQVESGAPADIFISADTEWMDYLDRRKQLKPGSRVDLLRNRIVLIAPSDSKTSVSIGPQFPLRAALGNERLAMADPDHVPAGKYGKAALESLGVWPSVANRIARGEDVRAALNFVARGEAPLGIVYQTDAAAEPRVRIVGIFPADTHPPIVYSVALVAQSKRADAADFLAFLQTPESGAIFRKHGFTPY